MRDIGLVSLTNVVCQVGIGMPGAAAALTTEDDGIAAAVAEWQARRDVILVGTLGPACGPAGRRLVSADRYGGARHEPGGRFAAPVREGQDRRDADDRLGQRGARAGRYLRFVFANEPCDRLAGLRERVRVAWSL